MSKRPESSSLRQQLRRIEAQRDRHLTQILESRLRMIRGSFVVLGKKCGKPNCRCAAGETHPTSYLSISEEGRKRMVHVRSADVAHVRDAAERYRSFREARAALARLSAELLTLVDVLQDCLVDAYPPSKPGEKVRQPPGPEPDEHETQDARAMRSEAEQARPDADDESGDPSEGS